MLVTLSGIVMLVRLVQLSKAAPPMLVTGFPSIVSGMTSSPVAASLQSVMVTSPPVVVHVKGVIVFKVRPFQSLPLAPKDA